MSSRPGIALGPRRRAPRVPLRRLLLRQADGRAVGDHVHRSVRRGQRRHAARTSRSIRRSSTRRAPSCSFWSSCSPPSGAAGAFAGRTFWLYMLLYAVSRYVIEIFRGDPRGMVGRLVDVAVHLGHARAAGHRHARVPRAQAARPREPRSRRRRRERDVHGARRQRRAPGSIGFSCRCCRTSRVRRSSV